MKDVTYEQFKVTLEAMSTKDIRRMIKDGYGIELPGGQSKAELIALAWQRLGNELPAGQAPSPEPEQEPGAPSVAAQEPAEAFSPASAVAVEADPAAAPAEEASTAARPPAPPAPKRKRYEARCFGIERRFRAGQYWSREWSPASQSQISELRTDARIKVREV